MISRRLLVALAFVVVASITTPTAALPPTGRRIVGIVQAVDVSAREATIVRTDTREAIGFAWIDRTLFVANGQFVSATMLQPGATVEVIYHEPFFGRPYVTRVTVLLAPDGGRVGPVDYHPKK